MPTSQLLLTGYWTEVSRGTIKAPVPCYIDAINTCTFHTQLESRPRFHVKPWQLPLVYSDKYSIPLPKGHRFPMSKYRDLYELLRAQGLAGPDNLYEPELCPQEVLQGAHQASYIQAVIKGQLSLKGEKDIGFPWSPELVLRSRTSVAGTLLCCRLAMRYGMAAHLAGGTHHAHWSQGYGFCVFNDIAVAALELLRNKEVKRLQVLDCDVHQGDGTASLLAKEPRCFTCSLHARHNYPFKKARSDLDIALKDRSGNRTYMEALEQALGILGGQAPPDLLIYDGGCDPHLGDRLGRLSLSDEGLASRDRRVLAWAGARGIPVACLIGGGYDRRREHLARRHAILIQAAAEVFRGADPSMGTT